MDLDDKRSPEFPCPVMFPAGLLYCRNIEDADEVRWQLVQRRREAERFKGRSPVRLKRRSVKGRMK